VIRARASRVSWTIDERITVRGPEFVGARMTPEAYSLGHALALPEPVRPVQEWVLAQPTGVERADAINIRIPIEGADAQLEDASA
jgi:hypothetical protein